MRSPVFLLPLITALVVGCGPVGDGPTASIERSMTKALESQLNADAPLSQIRTVDCAETRPNVTCDIQIGIANMVLSLKYDVTVAEDGCWQAATKSVAVIGSGANREPLGKLSRSSDLKGCLE